jgi:predicted nucleic acid-binding protein
MIVSTEESDEDDPPPQAAQALLQGSRSRSGKVPVPPRPVKVDRLLTHYFRYVLRDESDGLRERLLRGMMERTLKASQPDHSMTVASIQDRIRALYSLPGYPCELITQTLNRLVNRGDVAPPTLSKLGEPLYRLTAERFAVLDRVLEECEEQEHEFSSSVVRKIESAEGKLSAQETKLVADAFQDFVGRVLAALGEHCALNLVQERKWAGTPDYPSFERDLSEAVRALPSQVQHAAREAFQETLRNPSREEREYIYSIGQVYYMAELLHLDPELQTLQRDRFQETQLYLDTNILLAALLASEPQHDATLALIRLCCAAGFSLHYSERTAEEFESLLAAADEEFQRFPPVDADLAAERAELVANPVIGDYLASYHVHRLSWTQWRVEMAAWRGTLASEQVTVDPSCISVTRGPRYQHLHDVLSRPRMSKSGNPGRIRRPRAVEHDAELIASIEEMNSEDGQPSHPFGRRYWFITLDRRLAQGVSQSARADVGNVCMLAEEWVQYVSPFLGPDVSAEDAATVFSKLLSSRFFVSLGATLTLEELQPFTIPKVDELVARFSKQEATRLIAEAAQRVAQRGQELGIDRAEQSLNQLASLVERAIDEQRRSGELVPAAQVDRDVEVAASEKNAEIALLMSERTELRQQLAASTRHARWSPTYRLEQLRFAVLEMARWGRRHPRRGLSLGLVLASAAVVLALGWGGIVWKAVAVASVVAAVAFADPGIARANVRRCLGK